MVLVDIQEAADPGSDVQVEDDEDPVPGPLAGRAFSVGPVGQVHQDPEVPCLEVAFAVVLHLEVVPSSSLGRDSVENAADAADVADAADEGALVADVDADYGDADFDSAEEPELDVFCTETRIGSKLV